MKYFTLVILAFVLSACCGTKQIVEQTPKSEPQDNAQVLQKKKPVVKETPTAIEDKTKPVAIETSEKIEQKEVATETKASIEVLADGNKNLNTEAFKHDVWNTLLNDYVSDDGKVNYNKFKAHRNKLTSYITSLGENMPENNWTKEDKLAYWINAYNAMTVDLIVRNLPIKSIKDIKNPWEQRLWKLKSKWYNLDEIEHQILRKMDEPRIHFGIVCASFSCPKLQNEAFTASNLDTLLTTATKEFLSDTKRNKIAENNIQLSNIFKWFKKDFEQNGSLIDFLNKYSSLYISEKAKKSYLDYNWDLND